MSEPLVVVISGQVSAGKTTAAKMLRDRRDFQYARISQAIKKRWDGPEDEKPPRSWYQKMGMELHRTIGQRALCAETMELIPNHSVAFVIDGARWLEDMAYFGDQFGERLIHIHLTALTEIRKKRFERREKDVSFEEADGHEVEAEVPQLAAVADTVFDNSVDDKALLEVFLNNALERHSLAR